MKKVNELNKLYAKYKMLGVPVYLSNEQFIVVTDGKGKARIHTLYYSGETANGETFESAKMYTKYLLLVAVSIERHTESGSSITTRYRLYGVNGLVPINGTDSFNMYTTLLANCEKTGSAHDEVVCIETETVMPRWHYVYKKYLVNKYGDCIDISKYFNDRHSILNDNVRFVFKPRHKTFSIDKAGIYKDKTYRSTYRAIVSVDEDLRIKYSRLERVY